MRTSIWHSPAPMTIAVILCAPCDILLAGRGSNVEVDLTDGLTGVDAPTIPASTGPYTYQTPHAVRTFAPTPERTFRNSLIPRQLMYGKLWGNLLKGAPACLKHARTAALPTDETLGDAQFVTSRTTVPEQVSRRPP